LLVDISDGDVAISAFCSLCFLYLLVIVQLLVIPFLICGFGFLVVPVVVLLVLFVVTTQRHTHALIFVALLVLQGSRVAAVGFVLSVLLGSVVGRCTHAAMNDLVCVIPPWEIVM
jgi:hypothetical protein